MSAITRVDNEICTCYKPGWWAKRMCVNGWGPCYYTARLANLTPRAVAEEYVRRHKAVGNEFHHCADSYSGGSNYGGRLRYQVGGYFCGRSLRNYEMSVQIDNDRQVFDLRKLWGALESDKPQQAALF